MRQAKQNDTLKLRVFLTTIVTAILAALGAAEWTLRATEPEVRRLSLASTSAPTLAAKYAMAGESLARSRSEAALGAILVGLLTGMLIGAGAWRIVGPMKASMAELLLRMGAVLDHAEVGIALSRDGHFEMTSARLRQILRCQREDELIGKPTSTIHANAEAYKAFSDRAHPIFMAQGSFEGEVELTRLDGSPFWARMLGRALAPGDRSKGTIWVIEDVTESRRKLESLSFAANHDGLTGLINRVAFERLLDGAVAIASSAPFCTLFIDLDYFKQVNDTAGHAAGDALLKGLAASFRSCLRRADVVARLGGDEFGVILPGCPAGKARELADMLRKAVRDYRLRWEGRDYSVGVSIGLVIADGRHGNTAHLMHEADMACYEAKRGGRNRVSESSATPAVPGTTATSPSTVTQPEVQARADATQPG